MFNINGVCGSSMLVCVESKWCFVSKSIRMNETWLISNAIIGIAHAHYSSIHAYNDRANLLLPFGFVVLSHFIEPLLVFVSRIPFGLLCDWAFRIESWTIFIICISFVNSVTHECNGVSSILSMRITIPAQLYTNNGHIHNDHMIGNDINECSFSLFRSLIIR